MRPSASLLGLLTALILLAPFAAAGSLFPDSPFEEDPWGRDFARADAWGSGAYAGGGGAYDDGGDVLVRLSDGRTVWVDAMAFKLISTQKGKALTDADVLPLADYRECTLRVGGRVASEHCADVYPYEAAALAETGQARLAGYGAYDSYGYDDPLSSFGLGLPGFGSGFPTLF